MGALDEGDGSTQATDGNRASSGKLGGAEHTGGTHNGCMRPRPLIFAGRPARQHDPTSCGAACLVVLRALGDPALARDLDAAPGAFSTAMSAQRDATAHAALGLLPWPRALGTPPWTAAREARFPGVRYVSRPLLSGSSHPATLRRALESAHRATLAGLPVPIYSGHFLLDRTPARSLPCPVVLPRHVVLALPASPARPAFRPDGASLLHVYEPGSGLVHPVSVDELAAAHRPEPRFARARAALGQWPQIGWILLPTRRPRRPGRIRR